VLPSVLTCAEPEAAELDTLLFGSLDGGAGTFASAGAKIAAGSLAEDGLLSLLTVGGGVRGERIACGCGRNHTLLRETGISSALLGYQWYLPEGVVAAFLGGETVVEKVGPVTFETREGLRFQAEAWLRPTELSLVTGTVIAGTARGDGWGRIAWGYRLWDAYLGPEGSAYLDATGYRKAAAGVHATDVALADIKLRLSVGLQWETGRHAPSPYLAVSAWAPW